jgi:predicted HD phosphohydrolase
MRPDKYRRRQQASRSEDRVKGQIAREAAKRLFPKIGPEAAGEPLRETAAADYYAAKCQAAAVLGHRVRPGDLPSDHEVREAALELATDHSSLETPPEPAADTQTTHLADHLDRFDLYKLRLEPLESVKQSAKTHPEGDALYHSLQVFELARSERPYDEEFLLAALLHDVGKAIDPSLHVSAGLEALGGSIPERTAWLIGHQHDAASHRAGTLKPRMRRALGASDDFEDLVRLRELDEAGRVPGAQVPTVDEALDYLRGLNDPSDD